MMAGGSPKRRRLGRAVVQQDAGLPGSENINDADDQRCGFGKSLLQIGRSQRQTKRRQRAQDHEQDEFPLGRHEQQNPGDITDRRERSRNLRIFPKTEYGDEQDDGEKKPPGSKQCSVDGDDDERKCGEDALHCEVTAISSISGSGPDADSDGGSESPPKRRSRR